MRASRLFTEATRYLRPQDLSMIHPEAEDRYDARRVELCNRVDTLISRVEDMEPHERQALSGGLRFHKAAGEQKVGLQTLHIVSKAVQFRVGAEGEFNDLVRTDQVVRKHLTIGMNRLVEVPGGDSEGPQQSVLACDVITELSPAPEGPFGGTQYEIADLNPFIGFQILERTDWRHPVFESETPWGIMLSEQALAEGAVRMVHEGWESNFSNIHASLDDLTRLVAPLE